MTQPENTTLQYGDMDGNIAHLGILASNTYSTSNLSSTFPTTPTETSLGHYHYTETTTNALQFLNASGTGIGGHQFWNSNATNAPVKYFDINKDRALVDTQYVVDKSTSSTTLIPLPNITISGSVFVITATPVNVPPFNIVGVGNPVQVNSNCANLSTGITYYATGLSTQSMEICTNIDGTGIIDTSDLSSQPQPILSWVSGTSTIQKTSVLSDVLTITNDTDIAVLSSTDLTFNTISLPSSVETLTIKQMNTLQVYSSPAIYADGRPPLAVPSSSSNTYAQFGWYFKNTTAGWKIN